MEIKTKTEIGQRVYWLTENKTLDSSTVRGIRVTNWHGESQAEEVQLNRSEGALYIWKALSNVMLSAESAITMLNEVTK